MTIKETHVKTGWGGKATSYYLSLGYTKPAKGEDFIVKIEHLSKGSQAKVTAICEECGKERNVSYKTYAILCLVCANKKTHALPGFKEMITERISKAGAKWGKQHKGELSPHWNPNKTEDERKNARNNPENAEWSKQVKIIYGFTCQVCRKKSGTMNSHHLMSYQYHPELRLDLDNGVCLCRSCHLNFHSAFGNRNNTKKQFEEFVNNFYQKASLCL